MSIEQRIRYILDAAERAEREGHDRAARALRRMAEERRPLGAGD
jgi:hypothetical protein